ncbi:UDP-3-O-acyl-N-acetylglucosamine deacetylase [Desulfohalovibrio reitneri]|uniref:UDP-3-O-acyl-N-acetylglucosamine deacetylase n=1 Tax=Desulfohalovibrio reitneri TaxID=1307759 RepID=UPI0004A71215|nr:UDP-3-O-acyl-N-acetylglucosamine deacetylase [Desulfohalovibrio reitneri]
MFQKTIRKAISCSGIGLHSGRKVSLSLRPAPEDTGILFCLRDGEGTRFLKPDPKAVQSTRLATTLTRGKDSLSTVEHLMAAVRGMGVDNIRVEAEGGELPIMDGSAAPFVYLLRMAGTQVQSAPKRVLALTRELDFEREDKWIRAKPYQGFRVDYTISFDHPRIGDQRFSIDLTPESFSRKLAKARTFGFLREVEFLRSNGLALGGSLENAVVLDEYNVINEDGLRFKDEFVRHKVLDFAGDMAVAELPLWGHFQVFASGHGLNNEFLRYLVDNSGEYLREVTLSRPTETREGYVPGAEPVGQPAVA